MSPQPCATSKLQQSRRWPCSAWAFLEKALPGDPRAFELTEAGSGAFGRWILDAAGLPAYRYELDQYQDSRAHYPNTEGRDRHDHWHQIGNDRITALASNDGTVQVYLADRGGIFLNRADACNDSDAAPPRRRVLTAPCCEN
jgi:hypothetical protein